MVRRSPQTERLVEIVEYLADRPTDGRSLADISRTLGADKATLFPMLTELTRVGWVVKHPIKKTYRLGPRLAPVGDSARIAVNAIAPARKPMSRLAIESGNVCCLIVPSGGDLVVAEVAHPEPDDRPLLGVRAGDKITHRPPLGSVLVAWADDFAITAWLDRNPVVAEDSSRYRAVLDLIRNRRFAVEQYPPEPAAFRDVAVSATSIAYGSERASRFTRGQEERLNVEMLVGEIDDAQLYRPLSVNSPVFDRERTVVGSLCLLDVPEAITGGELRDIGHRLRDTADDITAELGGVVPG